MIHMTRNEYPAETDLQARIASLEQENMLLRSLLASLPRRTNELNALNQDLQAEIAERLRVTEALNTSEALYRAMARHFPNGAVHLYDHDLRYILSDGEILHRLGLSSIEMEGCTLWEALGEETGSILAPYYRAALVGESHTLDYEYHDYLFKVFFQPVRDETGQIIAGLVMTQDVTEQKRTEEALMDERALLSKRVEERTSELEIANTTLAAALKAKDEFLAGMSHELRTPLNSILGLAESIQEGTYGPLASRQAEMLQVIQESGRHLLGLINDILDLSKIESGQDELHLSDVEIDEVCEASMRMVAQLARKKRLHITRKLDPRCASFTADERRLKQILVNLLSNAVKFTPEGGRVGLEVVADPDDNRLIFTVWDTGIGIEPEQQARLFQPFVQLDSSLARQHQGTGLGLALVARLSDLHGGGVNVDSVPNVGSRFTVTLPWRTAAPPPPPEPAETAPIVEPLPAPADPTSSPLILLAEDNKQNIQLMTEYLNAHNYRVAVVTNGVDAVQQTRELRPDLILMDVQMPGMDGLEATRHIRADAELAAVPIIAITALAMPQDEQRCLEAGANAYLAKPVSLRALKRLLSEQLVCTW